MAGPKSDLSLAQAIFGPLSAIFESQVQASRAFLNYVLSMGFKQLHTADELEKFKAIRNSSAYQRQNFGKLGELEDTELDKLIKKAEDHVRLRDLRAQKVQSPQDAAALSELSKEHEGLHYQVFQVKRADDNIEEYSIPTLALLPMRPLSIEGASVKFSMEVAESNHSDEVRKNAVSSKRPWMTIDPIDIKGSIQSKSSESSSSSIEIEIKIGTAPMPAGLESVLTALSNNIVVHSDPKQ